MSSSNLAVLAVVALCFSSVLLFEEEWGIPIFSTEPEDTVLTSVGNFRFATLYCKPSSTYGVSVPQWYKDNMAIMGSVPSYSITNTSLVLATTDVRDDGLILEGSYYCVISNNLGAVRSRSVFVRAPRVVSSFRPLSSIFYPNETTVAAEVGYIQQPILTNRTLWQIDCKQKTLICTRSASCSLWHHVSVAGRLLLFSILRVTYQEIQKSIPDCLTTDSITVTGTLDYGMSPMIYTFQFSPDNGLEQFLPRKTLDGVQNVSVQVGKNVTLYCISNHPNSTYTWKRNGSLIQIADDSRYSFIIDGVLQIQSVLERDGGQYECGSTANYLTFGQQTRLTEVNLTVYKLPAVNLTVIEDGTETANLWCDCNGSKPLLVQLLHNDVVLLEQTVTDDQRSVQQNVTLSLGIYQCIATNPYGSKQISVYVPGPTTSAPTARSPKTTSSLLPTSAQTTTAVDMTHYTTASHVITQTVSGPSATLPATAKSTTASLYSTTTLSSSTQTASSTSASTTSSLSNPAATTKPVGVTISTTSQVSVTSRGSRGNISTTVSASSVTTSRVRTSNNTTVFQRSTSSSRPDMTSKTTGTKSSSLSSSSRSATDFSTPAAGTTPSATTTFVSENTTQAQENSAADSFSVVAVAGGAAGGGIVLLLLVALIVVFCYRRKQSFSPESAKSNTTIKSSTVFDNPSYGNKPAANQEDPHNTDDTGKDISSFYETVDKPTAVVQPVRRQTETKRDKSNQADQYDVLDRKTDELPITTFYQPAEGYSVLKGNSNRSSSPAKGPSSSDPTDGEYSYATTDSHPIQSSIGTYELAGATSVESYELVGDAIKSQAKRSPSRLPSEENENPYAVPIDEKPKSVASAVPSVPQADSEYSYATTDVKRPVSASPDHVAVGGDEYALTEKQVKQRSSVTSTGAYEDVVIDAPNPKRSVGSHEEDAYAVPDNENKKSAGKTAAPPETEYSYARPDEKRPMTMSASRLVVGAAITAKGDKDDSARQSSYDEEENPYAVPDGEKERHPLNELPTLPSSTAEYAYARPDVKRPISVPPDEVTVGADEYAVSTKHTKRFQSDTTAKPSAKRVPSNPSDHFITGEDQYAVSTKQSTKKASSREQTRSDAPPSFTTPEHFAGEDDYSLSSEQSVKEKQHSDRKISQQPEHYKTGEDQYAVSTKARSPSVFSQKAHNSAAAVDQTSKRRESADVQYAELDEFEAKPKRKGRKSSTQSVEYATIDHDV